MSEARIRYWEQRRAEQKQNECHSQSLKPNGGEIQIFPKPSVK